METGERLGASAGRSRRRAATRRENATSRHDIADKSGERLQIRAAAPRHAGGSGGVGVGVSDGWSLVRGGGNPACAASRATRHEDVTGVRSRALAACVRLDPWWRNGKSFKRRWKLEVGSRKLEAGSWKLEAGSWKLEAGRWKLEAGRWKLEAGRWKPEVGSRKLEAGSWKPEVGSWKLEAGSWKLFSFFFSFGKYIHRSREGRRELLAAVRVLTPPF
ncbi:hypothetical protein EYF80_011720 [Liparis tanakae]|uniref:Uncharacterized protein n=1 Tax=Liparis tanakae TaxID=230148 RepID=A0A4Z2IJG2_9TELE|nr:hypothetical protein EYF80_011720 [Liparis tanakae]